MSRKPKAYILDSWAVLAYLEDEGASQKVADLIADAHEHGVPLLMSVVNAGEVWYILAREVSDGEADKGVEGLRQLGIEFVDVDWKLARQAGTYKSRNRMSYADCFAAALAKEHKAELVTGDKEFQQVQNDVKICWL
ncbi:MAG TPA: type II toxin-antitoxin system VapC family toxin [Candidatus Methylomirabilis sp.]|nr:type II toxin-antitoxin system VapC family toxin [Candidatus Methylomirabilis sp.]